MKVPINLDTTKKQGPLLFVKMSGKLRRVEWIEKFRIGADVLMPVGANQAKAWGAKL
jgi:hypothetical protein